MPRVNEEELHELLCNALDEPALLHLYSWNTLAAVIIELAERRKEEKELNAQPRA